ncbi:MAG: RNA methyltransferase [Bacteroidales bacterium]|nr:RNA methyltransferase [Bacteroidales bacterium]
MKKLTMPELNRLTVEEYKAAEKTPIVIVLDNIRSQHNIGSVFRTADAFRLEGILLCGITATPPHREIQKTALGATESVPWQYFDNTIDACTKLINEGYHLLAIEQVTGSIPLYDFQPAKDQKLAIIFGNEVSGVREDALSMATGCLEIPQFGTKHSFNISVSAGIVIWDIFSKLNYQKVK